MFSVASLLTFFALTANAIDHPKPQSTSCTCSSGFITVPVDVTIPVDPSNPQGLNTTDTMRLRTTFEVYGTLCKPVSEASQTGAIQMLLHGLTYTSQYWDVTWGGFQNYSYIAQSCQRGVSSFAYDNLDAGHTIRQNSTHIQLPTVASVCSSLAKDLKSGRISRVLTGTDHKYEKIVGIGHSQGSATLNYVAITEGDQAPFDGLILTGLVHLSAIPKFLDILPASEVDPVRWANLDPGYITTTDISARSDFYGPDNGTSFSKKILQLDELTKDAGTKWVGTQIFFLNVPASGFKAPVVEMVGSVDQLFCPPPCEQAKLQISEAHFFPDSRNFTMIVLEGYGHDLNYEFGAAEEFQIMAELYDSFIH